MYIFIEIRIIFFFLCREMHGQWEDLRFNRYSALTSHRWVSATQIARCLAWRCAAWIDLQTGARSQSACAIAKPWRACQPEIRCAQSVPKMKCTFITNRSQPTSMPASHLYYFIKFIFIHAHASESMTLYVRWARTRFVLAESLTCERELKVPCKAVAFE